MEFFSLNNYGMLCHPNSRECRFSFMYLLRDETSHSACTEMSAFNHDTTMYPASIIDTMLLQDGFRDSKVGCNAVVVHCMPACCYTRAKVKRSGQAMEAARGDVGRLLSGPATHELFLIVGAQQSDWWKKGGA